MSRPASPARRTAVLATLVAALTAAATLATLTTTAHGEPACHNVNGFSNPAAWGIEEGGTRGQGVDSGIRGGEQYCRDANELAAGEHESRAFWQKIAGADWPEDEVPADDPETPLDESSPTPVTVDLFAVRQRNAREVFAGGAACADGTPAEELETCTRVPVIYATNEESPWHEDYISDDPGYVGAIAWIGRGEALAVGGDGAYPRREFNSRTDTGDFDARAAFDRAEGAGDARAWHFYDGDWHEISDSLPEEMGGLSALDIWIGREEDGDEWGLAGDYGHIWEWEGGEFTTKHLDNDSPSIGADDPEWAVVEGPISYRPDTGFGATENSWIASPQTSSAQNFQYRVREIRIAPDRNLKRAFAFTSGCCGPQAAGGSRMIEYLDAPRANEAGVDPGQATPPPRGARPHWRVRDDDAAPTDDGEPATRDHGESVYSFAVKPDRFWSPDAEDEFGERQPDNYVLTWDIDTAKGLVKSTADPEGSPPSAVANPTTPPQPRYVASDGDTEPTRPSWQPGVIGNGIPDWKVGEVPPEDPELRGLGILATTVSDYKPEYGGLRPRCGRGYASDEIYQNASPDPVIAAQSLSICRAEQIQAGDQPTLDSDGPIRTRESGIQAGPSWSLNAIDMLDAENIGYAVGDRGAIMRFAEPPVESDPPSLGARRPAQLQDRSPYDGARPETAALAGEVPPLASQPREQFDDPRMVRAGSPHGSEIDPEEPVEGIQNVVMSRDGSEGWAIGHTPGLNAGDNIDTGSSSETKSVMTLYHYVAGQWTRCDPVGIRGVEDPDSACASLADVYRHQDNLGRRVTLSVAARIPLEFDPYPSNDDEFEVLAVGTTYEKGVGTADDTPAVLRYSKGRWTLEDLSLRRSLGIFAGRKPLSLACVGPRECWLVGYASNYTLSRYDGERWIDCTKTSPSATPLNKIVDREGCGDLGDKAVALDFYHPQSAPLSVASAGERVYLAGSRPDRGTGALQQLSLATGPPLIVYKDADIEDAPLREQWQTEGGGYDPAASDTSALSGVVRSVSVARRPDGSYEGWAVGAFEPLGLPAGKDKISRWPLLRLDPESGEWGTWRVHDASYDYLGIRARRPDGFFGTPPARQVTLPGSGAEPGRAYVGYQDSCSSGGCVPSHLLTFSPASGRWELAEQPGLGWDGRGGRSGLVAALAADNRGGIWAGFQSGDATNARNGYSETYFYNYTQSPPQEVFTETAHPLAANERLTDLAGARDGTIWLSTDRGALYRRDRLAGWERVTVPGWDPGRVVTRPTPIEAVALAPAGTGIAVGGRGRIAELGADSVRLSAAAGTVCDAAAPQAPCGTSFDLTSAAVAPGGAAMVGGEKLALLGRDAGGEFTRIASPDAPPAATITGISMPTPRAPGWQSTRARSSRARAPGRAGAGPWRTRSTSRESTAS